MKLNINMPSYFSREHGIDNEIYCFFRNITKFFEDKSYSEAIETIGLMPIIVPKEMIEKGLWSEQCKIDRTCKLAIISKQINYIEYLNADIDERKKLMVENILSSVKSIEKKGKFKYKQFEKDLRMWTSITL